MTNEYSAQMQAAKQSIADKTKGLSPELLRLRLRAIANGGFVEGAVDPLERSWAKQAIDVLDTQDELARVAKAYADLEVSREPGMSKAQKLFSLNQLEEKHHLLKIKLIQTAEQDHRIAAQEAQRVGEAREAKAAEVVAIRAAAEARAEAMLLEESSVVADLAAAIVARKRAI